MTRKHKKELRGVAGVMLWVLGLGVLMVILAGVAAGPGMVL